MATRRGTVVRAGRALVELAEGRVAEPLLFVVALAVYALVSIALPRIRDFRGLSPASLDGRGNYSLGVREQIIFPEIDYDDVETVRGLDVTITTTAQSDEEALALLRALGLPFRTEA